VCIIYIYMYIYIKSCMRVCIYIYISHKHTCIHDTIGTFIAFVGCICNSQVNILAVHSVITTQSLQTKAITQK
jgi:hypothetical protein